MRRVPKARLQPLACVVGFDRFRLDQDRGVAALEVGRSGGDGAGDVAARQGYHPTAG